MWLAQKHYTHSVLGRNPVPVLCVELEDCKIFSFDCVRVKLNPNDLYCSYLNCIVDMKVEDLRNEIIKQAYRTIDTKGHVSAFPAVTVIFYANGFTFSNQSKLFNYQDNASVLEKLRNG